MNLMRPIPGMSLTKEPGNAPYENPPLYDTADQALGFYFEKLDDEEILDDMLFTLDNGYPVEAFIEAMTSVGVMEGFHSIDVKMIISPILHEYIVRLATAAEIDFVEETGPSKEERTSAKEKKRVKMLLKKEFASEVPVSAESMNKAEDALGTEGTAEDMPMGMDEAETGPAPEPLIPRRA